MTPKLSIIILESDDIAKNGITAVLNSFNGSIGKISAVANFQEVVSSIQADEAQIVFLEVQELEQGVRETAFLVARFPHCTVIATAAERSSHWILPLIRAGAGEYLTKPISEAELTAAIHKVIRLHRGRNGSVSAKGSVLSVYNPSGGMGTTTIAVNLAASLAALGENVVLVDLNLWSGDVTTFLDLAPRYTLSTITARAGEVDATFLRSVMVTHSSGVQVLCGPPDLREADRIQPDQLREVVALLRSIFTYTIIDTGGQLFGCNLATFDSSDLILFVTQLNLPALNNAKRYLAAMGNEGLGSDKVRLILNRYNSKDAIKVSDGERVLTAKAYLTVPNGDQEVTAAINEGAPLVTRAPRSPVATALKELAGRITAERRGGK